MARKLVITALLFTAPGLCAAAGSLNLVEDGKPGFTITDPCCDLAAL